MKSAAEYRPFCAGSGLLLAQEAKRLGCKISDVVGVIRETTVDDETACHSWTSYHGSSRLVASEPARQVFAIMPEITRGFLAASRPWLLALPPSVQSQIEIFDLLEADGQALNRLGAEVWWLCWDEQNARIEAWFDWIGCSAVEMDHAWSTDELEKFVRSGPRYKTPTQWPRERGARRPSDAPDGSGQ